MLGRAKVVVLDVGDLPLEDEGVGVHFNNVSTLASSPPKHGEEQQHPEHAKER
jgi:hypothetical protein